jgi:hypothetical protein
MSKGLSWATKQRIPTGVLGELYRGIPITEQNRVSNWVFSSHGKARLETLQKVLTNNYLDKGVRAVLFGVHDGPETIKYGIFVQPSFLEQE